MHNARRATLYPPCACLPLFGRTRLIASSMLAPPAAMRPSKPHHISPALFDVPATAEGAEGPPDHWCAHRCVHPPSTSPRTPPSDAACRAGIALLKADDFQDWFLSIEVLGNTLYQVRLPQFLCMWVCRGSLCWIQGEVFALHFRFDSSYPITPPAVTFVVDDRYQAPVHPVRPPPRPNHRSRPRADPHAARILQWTRTSPRTPSRTTPADPAPSARRSVPRF